ncbi:hypothetical protein DFH09DRAFT_1318999 [Mycena vulgaris]|nr:hypothetical protein DFH09DRAFT_1318999 [Mycena vulgaris]
MYQSGILEVSAFSGALGSAAPSAIPEQSAFPQKSRGMTLGLVAIDIDCTPSTPSDFGGSLFAHTCAVSTSSSHPVSCGVSLAHRLKLNVPHHNISPASLSLVLVPLEQEAVTPRLQPLHHVAFEQHLHSGPSSVSVSHSASSTHWRSSSRSSQQFCYSRGIQQLSRRLELGVSLGVILEVPHQQLCNSSSSALLVVGKPLWRGVFQHPPAALSFAVSSSSSYTSSSTVRSISAFSSHRLRLSVLQRSNGCIHLSLVGPCEPAKPPQRNAILCVIVHSLFSGEH